MATDNNGQQSNVNVKLQESFAAGTEKRAGVKKIAEKALPVAILAGCTVLFFSLMFWIVSDSNTGDKGFFQNKAFTIAVLFILAITVFTLKQKVYWVMTAVVCGALMVILFFVFFGQKAPEVLEKIQQRNSRLVFNQESNPDVTPQLDQRLDPKLFSYKVHWEKLNDDDTIPKDVPSKAIHIPNYCTIHAPTYDGAPRHHVEISEDGKNWYVPRAQRARANYIRYIIHEDGVKIFEVFMSPGC